MGHDLLIVCQSVPNWVTACFICKSASTMILLSIPCACALCCSLLICIALCFLMNCRQGMAATESPASVNGEYDPTTDKARKAKSDDPGWKYGYWANLSNRNR